jgi:tetratricopeptide (TPR) repeat protein
LKARAAGERRGPSGPEGPASPALTLAQRLRGLTPQLAARWREASRWLDQGDTLMSGQILLELSLSAPHHPEVLRLRGTQHLRAGDAAAAARCLADAARQRPGDFALLLDLARAQDQAGDFAAALHALQRAMPCALTAQDRFALSVVCDSQGHAELALAAVELCLALQPNDAAARLQRVRCLKALGQAQSAAADCRQLIANGQVAARAWFSLVDLKTVALTAEERAELGRAAAAPGTAVMDQLLLDFACGKALEDAGDPDAAFAALRRGNQAAQVLYPWDAAAFSGRVDAVLAAFAAAPAVQARNQGREVLFLVGLPRSGSTLVEQVLASHSAVEGASELPYLNAVIEAESRRRARPFPLWVASASEDDWTRLGQHYLRLSARWRAQRPIATDKLPENWLLAGAALRMLPEARVIDCRRDALETCWSCYKQLFAPQRVAFTYSFEALAAYWADSTRAAAFWAARFPARFRVQHYEALVANPEGQIRELLAFCGLPFEADCLAFHQSQRAIRTPSALQVRQPLRQASRPAAGYGAVLDPLRHRLPNP